MSSKIRSKLSISKELNNEKAILEYKIKTVQHSWFMFLMFCIQRALLLLIFWFFYVYFGFQGWFNLVWPIIFAKKQFWARTTIISVTSDKRLRLAGFKRGNKQGQKSFEIQQYLALGNQVSPENVA